MVDCLDYELVAQQSWYLVQNGYAATKIKEGGRWVHVAMHALLMGRPKGRIIDHADGDRLNNRRANLRFVTAEQNAWNAERKPWGILPRWVSRVGSMFMARINVSRKSVYLGSYASPEAAAEAYRIAAERLHGEHAFSRRPS